MSDLEQRVTALEREMAALKGTVVSHDEELRNMPDLIKLEFRLSNARIDRLGRDMSEVKNRLGGLEGKVDALPRVLAELVVDMIKDPGKTRS